MPPLPASSSSGKSAARVRQSRGRQTPLSVEKALAAQQAGPSARGNTSLYSEEVGKMMYTHGDARTTDPHACNLMESIARDETINLIKATAKVARMRGSPMISVSDVAFTIRHDKAKLRRLLDFLGWKEVRQKVAAEDASTKETQEMETEPTVEGDELIEKPEETIGGLASLKMSWDFLAELARMTGSTVELDQFSLINPDRTRDLQRQETADQITESMSKTEYIDYTECRQASFTYKKQKKFREWLNNLNFIEFNPNQDVMEVIGYLTWEIVASITESAIKIRDHSLNQKIERAHSEGDAMVVLRAEQERANTPALTTADIYEALRRLRSPTGATSISATSRRCGRPCRIYA